MKDYLLTGFCAVFVLSGCVTVTEEVATANKEAAYVFGNFSFKKGTFGGADVAIKLKNMATGEDVSIELRKEDTVYAVEVAPGEYRLDSLVMMDMFNIVTDTTSLEGAFSIQEGQALYIGDFEATLSSSFLGGQKLKYTRTLSNPGKTINWIRNSDPSFADLNYYFLKSLESSDKISISLGD